MVSKRIEWYLQNIRYDRVGLKEFTIEDAEFLTPIYNLCRAIKRI